MNIKRWALLVLCIVLIVGYIKLFYKTYNVNTVVKNADCIVAIDVKRITNTLLWNIITTPSQWKTGNIFSRSKKKEISWKDMIEIPDYIFAFHVADQPVNTWYVVLKIKDGEEFNTGLQNYHFQKLDSNEYVSNDMGIRFFKSGNQVLVTSQPTENNNYLTTVADALFSKKSFVEKKLLDKAIAAKSHLAVYIAANIFLAEDGIIKANFDNQKIEWQGEIKPRQQYQFSTYNFPVSSGALLNAGFTQPGNAVYHLLDSAAANKISKVLNVNTDSVFRQDNHWYGLDITAIQSRTDSAITYVYDDDFNKVEKIVVNNIIEPAYSFSIGGDSVKAIYQYFLHHNKLEQTDAGQLFTPVPFVKSYCTIVNEKLLAINAAGYSGKTDLNRNCIFFVNMAFDKMPAGLLNYFPAELVKVISNVESFKLIANKKMDQVTINCIIQKKKNNLPLLKL
jgi:hypothetical protein